VVNTCGFIDEAVDESLEAIGEAMAARTAACWSPAASVPGPTPSGTASGRARHHRPARLRAGHGRGARAPAPAHDPFTDLVPPQGVRLTPRHYAYLKISEGCNNKCSFCIIPDLRGRSPAAHRRGAARGRGLVRAGVRELLVISQDTSAYGSDIATGRTLARRALRDAVSSTWPARWASSAPGCACTTSIPTRTWTRCCR
jgi:ribosomal protein S12 methylthiotransferase